MLLVTEDGHYFTVVEDFKDDEVLWVRSQDRQSIEHAARVIGSARGSEPRIIDEPTWDYQFRIAASREEWAGYLAEAATTLCAHKLKPAVAAARGYDHPVSKMVAEVFYFGSENRPDGSKPGWLTGTPRRNA